MSGVLPVEHARHRELMHVATRRAVRALGRTHPNPCVGAVVAVDGHIVSVGHHARAGTAHAEVVALQAAGPRARGADLYVTLEPCNHHGRTPPCVDAIVAAGVARVFVAVPDVNPRVSGGGIGALRRAGLAVHVGHGADAARELAAPFFTSVTRGRPEIILKVAQSVDGRLATATGESAGLSGRRAQAWLHRLRDRVDGILVGIGTVLHDNPRLTPRRPSLRARGPHAYVRIVLDDALRLPADAALYEDVDRFPLWLICRPDAPADRRAAATARGAVVQSVPATEAGVDLGEALAWLGRQGLTRVLVEGGALVHGSLLQAQLADRVALVLTPRLLGNSAVPMAVWDASPRLARTPRIDAPTWRTLGTDQLLEGLVRYSPE